MTATASTTWLPVTSIAQLRPGTVVRDRKHTDIVQAIEFRRGRLVRFADSTHTTVAAAKRYLDFKAA